MNPTDWRRILHYYDLLVGRPEIPRSSLSTVPWPSLMFTAREREIEAVEAIREPGDQLDSYYLRRYAVGEFEERLGAFDAAAEHFERALSLAAMKSEQAFLARRLRECEARTPPAVRCV